MINVNRFSSLQTFGHKEELSPGQRLGLALNAKLAGDAIMEGKSPHEVRETFERVEKKI